MLNAEKKTHCFSEESINIKNIQLEEVERIEKVLIKQLKVKQRSCEKIKDGNASLINDLSRIYKDRDSNTNEEEIICLNTKN